MFGKQLNGKSQPMKDFKGKIAVITGAGRGLGRGIALHYAKKGMKIVLADIPTAYCLFYSFSKLAYAIKTPP